MEMMSVDFLHFYEETFNLERCFDVIFQVFLLTINSWEKLRVSFMQHFDFFALTKMI